MTCLYNPNFCWVVTSAHYCSVKQPSDLRPNANEDAEGSCHERGQASATGEIESLVSALEQRDQLVQHGCEKCANLNSVAKAN